MKKIVKHSYSITVYDNVECKNYRILYKVWATIILDFIGEEGHLGLEIFITFLYHVEIQLIITISTVTKFLVGMYLFHIT